MLPVLLKLPGAVSWPGVMDVGSCLGRDQVFWALSGVTMLSYVINTAKCCGRT